MFNLPTQPNYKEKYLYGFPEKTRKQPVIIKLTESSLDFYFNKLLKYEKIAIPATDIIEVGFGSESYRSGGRAAAGAIIGGALTGGIGLLAGAALGGRRRKENYLSLIIKHNGEDCVIALNPSKSIPKLYADIRRLTSKISP